MSDQAKGWWPDPTGRHQWRHFADGHPTDFVRDGDIVGEDRFHPSAQDGPQWGNVAAGNESAPLQAFRPEEAGQPYAPPPAPWGPRPPAAGPIGYGNPQAQWPGYPPAESWYSSPEAGATVHRRWLRIGVIAGAAVILAVAVTVWVVSRGSTPKAVSDYPAGGGVPVSDTAAHFRARFPTQPRLEVAPTLSVGTVKLVIHAAVLREPHVVFVEEGETSVAMNPDEYDAQLRGAIGGFEGSSGLTLKSQKATTFLGHPARQAEMSSHTTTYTVLFFIYDRTRMYGLCAPSGPTFTTLSESFAPLS